MNSNAKKSRPNYGPLRQAALEDPALLAAWSVANEANEQVRARIRFLAKQLDPERAELSDRCIRRLLSAKNGIRPQLFALKANLLGGSSAMTAPPPMQWTARVAPLPALWQPLSPVPVALPPSMLQQLASPTPTRATPRLPKDRARPPCEETRPAKKKKTPPPPPPPAEECPICLDVLDDASALDCGHRFHAGCIREVIAASASTATRGSARVECPMCRRVTRVPQAPKRRDP